MGKALVDEGLKGKEMTNNCGNPAGDNIRPHRRLEVWKLAMEFVWEVYRSTEGFPAHEQYGLRAQLRRAAVSVPSNIAEGAARKGTKECTQFLNIAQGSMSELDTQLELALMLGYIERQTYDTLTAKLTTISRMLYGLSRNLDKKRVKGKK
jgi:four helix bundle protein